MKKSTKAIRKVIVNKTNDKADISRLIDRVSEEINGILRSNIYEISMSDEELNFALSRREKEKKLMEIFK